MLKLSQVDPNLANKLCSEKLVKNLVTDIKTNLTDLNDPVNAKVVA